MYLKIHFLNPVPICFHARSISSDSLRTSPMPRSKFASIWSKMSRASLLATSRAMRLSSACAKAARRLRDEFGFGPPCGRTLGSKKLHSLLYVSIIFIYSREIPLLDIRYARLGRLMAERIWAEIQSSAKRWRVLSRWGGVRGGTLRSESAATMARTVVALKNVV